MSKCISYYNHYLSNKRYKSSRIFSVAGEPGNQPNSDPINSRPYLQYIENTGIWKRRIKIDEDLN